MGRLRWVKLEFDPEALRVKEAPEVIFGEAALSGDVAERVEAWARGLAADWPEERSVGLFYGLPGTGKTYLCGILTQHVMNCCGDCAVYRVMPGEAAYKSLGMDGRKIEALFAAMKAHRHALLILDDVQGLLPEGDDSDSARDTRDAFLRGLRDTRAQVITTTATPWAVSRAFLDEVDWKVRPDLPDAQTRKQFLLDYPSYVLGADEETSEAAAADLAARTEGQDFRFLNDLRRFLALEAFGRKTLRLEPDEIDDSRFAHLTREEIDEVFGRQTLLDHSGELERIHQWNG